MDARIEMIDNGWLLHWDTGLSAQVFHYEFLDGLLKNLERFLREYYPSAFKTIKGVKK